MPTWAIIVLVVHPAILLLALLGALATTVRSRRRAGRFGTRLDEVDRSLADARATDRGWERGRLEAAARGAFQAARPGAEIRELTLVQVLDRPGTEDDKAVFRVVAADAQARVTLGRVDGEWVGEAVEAD